MALNLVGRVLVAGSLLVALVALFWPFLEANFIAKAQDERKLGCPLGYASLSGGMKLPENHPPVFMKSSMEVTKVFVNANIWTGVAQGDGALQWASAIAVGADGVIVSVDNATQTPSEAEVVDLEGRFVLPGLVDAHAHVINGGMSLFRCALHGVTSRQEFLSKVQAAAAQLAPGAWLLGSGWDEVAMAGAMPEAAWLDEVLGPRPALLHRMDGHLGVASSTALQLAHIDASIPDPPHGIIDRYPDGRPTGILREHALDLVQDVVPPASKEEREEALQAAARNLLSAGVTTVGDMGRYDGGDSVAWDDLMDVYFDAAAAKKLPFRIAAYMPLSTAAKLAEFIEAQGGQRLHSSKRLAWGGLKGFADGSLGSRTALMWEAYVGEPNNYGTRVTDVAVMQQFSTVACDAGLQVAIHAIGDRAVDDVLELQVNAGGKAAASQTPSERGQLGSPCPPRVEHAQHLHNASVARRFASAGVFAVTNPQHLLSDVAMLEDRLGPERAGPGRAFAFGTMLKAKVPMAFGSDWPVVGAGPLQAVFAAVARRAPGSDPSTAWSPSESISVEAALMAHTSIAAQACALDGLVGALRPGLQADFVVLGASTFDMVASNALPKVLSTYVAGECQYGCQQAATAVPVTAEAPAS